jgi:Glycosyltransferases involved in cell wall biogenesis
MISVVIPAYNEEKTIADVVSRTHSVMKTVRLPFELLVVDDGSTDHTRDLIPSGMAQLLTNGKNHGKGSALRTGFRRAKGDIIVTIDSDGSHDPEDIRRLLAPVLNGSDVVMGSRFANGKGKKSTRKLHIFGNRLINLLIGFVTGKRITDSQTGLRAFKRKAIDYITLTSNGYQVETELTVKTLRNGSEVEEISIDSMKRKNGASQLKPLYDGVRIFMTIVRSRINA